MKNVAKTVVIFFVLTALVTAAYRISRPSERNSSASVTSRPEAVTVGEVTRGAIEEDMYVTGEVEAIAKVALAPKVGGRLMQLAAAEGGRVTSGDLVAELDKEAFESQVNQARAAVEVAKANVVTAEATRANAEKDFRRAEALRKEAISSQAEYEDAQSGLEVAAAGVEVAKAAVAQAEAALEAAAIQLKEASIYAPFDAVVSAKLLDPGALVAPSQPILELIAIDTVKVKAGVSEKHLGDLVEGATKAVVTVDSLEGRTFPGRVCLVSPTIDEATRTAEVEVRIANADFALKPGMYARMRLLTRHNDDALLMPEDALLGREGAYYAYVVSDNRARRAPVEVGLRGSGSVEATRGVAAGDRVITSGEGDVFDGAAVSVEAAPGRAAAAEAVAPAVEALRPAGEPTAASSAEAAR